jgi:hypothetical protein
MLSRCELEPPEERGRTNRRLRGRAGASRGSTQAEISKWRYRSRAEKSVNPNNHFLRVPFKEVIRVVSAPNQ